MYLVVCTFSAIVHLNTCSRVRAISCQHIHLCLERSHQFSFFYLSLTQEQAFVLATMFVTILGPSGWILANLENYKKHD